MQILWSFQVPTALNIALTRCALSIFFLRSLYTKLHPWLRCIGMYLAKARCSVVSLLILLHSILLRLPCDCRGPARNHWHSGSLPTDEVQLYHAVRESSILLQAQTFDPFSRNSGSCPRRLCLDHATLDCLEAATSNSPQVCNHSYLRPRSAVQYYVVECAHTSWLTLI